VALAESSYLQNLFFLVVCGNHIGENGRQALRERFGDRVSF